MTGYCKVLIVDDEFIMRQGMKHMMEWEKEGFQIIGEAANGQEGLELVRKLRPHIVLADIVMPRVDGIEFSKIMGKNYPEIQLMILSSYDKFEYVKETLLNGASDYILKPTINPENLLQVLKKAAKKIPGITLTEQTVLPCVTQMERVLSGYQEQLDQEEIKAQFTEHHFCMLGADVRAICGVKKEEIALLKQTIENYLADNEVMHGVTMFLKERVVCILINYKMENKEQIVQMLTELTEHIERMYGSAFFVLSHQFEDISKIKQVYDEEITAYIGEQFYHEAETLFKVNGKKQETKLKRFEYEQFTEELSYGRYEEALFCFEEYIQYLSEKKAESDIIKNLAKNLLYNYLMEIEKFQIESERLKMQYFKRIDQSKYIEEFLHTMTQIMQEIRTIIETKVRITDPRIEEIKQYVIKHYNEALELSDLATEFGLNYNYLSTYFSKAIKMSFSEFLNKIRIEKACELLSISTFTIAEVGAMTGYSDHSYFCRVFRKMKGETPSAYRKKKYTDV